jgi:hypothetical protein
MAQIFHRSTNTISRVSIFGGLALVIALTLVVAGLYRSAYVSEIGVARAQPVPFSHKHHVTDDGIDCRYCHTSVETSSFAGVPSTKICMNCHTQIWPDSPALAPVRESFRTGQSIQWTRVYNLPGFAYFDHSIHVNKGVGCSTCHGRIDQMPLTWRVNTLYMDWCLECHRSPEQFVRPREQVFNMEYEPPENQLALGQKLIKQYDIRPLTSCSTCHR